MITTILAWGQNYPGIIKQLNDCTQATQGVNENTYILTGQFQHDQAHYSRAVFKRVNQTELQFYQGALYADNLAPRPMIIDVNQSCVLLEYLDPSPIWNTNRSLSKVFNIIQYLYTQEIPTWLELPFGGSEFPKQPPVQVISDLNIDRVNEQALIQGVHIVEACRDMITDTTKTICHGDLSYINAGMRHNTMLLYDWQNLCMAPIEYDLAYLFYVVSEFRKDMPHEGHLYEHFMHTTGITINSNLCRVLYLYRAIYEQLPFYAKHSSKLMQQVLHNRIPTIVGRINTWYKTQL